MEPRNRRDGGLHGLAFLQWTGHEEEGQVSEGHWPQKPLGVLPRPDSPRLSGEIKFLYLLKGELERIWGHHSPKGSYRALSEGGGCFTCFPHQFNITNKLSS